MTNDNLKNMHLKIKVFNFFKECFLIAINGKKLNIYHNNDKNKKFLQSLFECSSQFITLYAVQADIIFKPLNMLSVPVSYYWAKLLSSAFGIFLCGYIIFAVDRTTSKSIYRFRKISRIISLFLIWIMIYSFGQSVHGLFISKKTYIEYIPAYSIDIEPSNWIMEPGSDKSYKNPVKYTLDLKMIDKFKVEFTDLKIYIEPSKGYKLLETYPDNNMIVKNKSTEPLQVGDFEEHQSEWLLPSFDSSMNWKIITIVIKKDTKTKNPKKPPIVSKFYLN